MRIDVGKRIREIRQGQGLTQQTLAIRSGLTRSYLSMLESGKKVPAISTLARIAEVCGVSMGDFFEAQEDSPDIVVIRPEDRKPITKDSSSFGYAYETLASGKKSKIMEPFLVEVKPGKKRHEFIHQGEEFCFVLDGKIRLVFKEQEIILNKGDCVYFDSSFPHKWEAIGSKAGLLISVNSHRKPEEISVDAVKAATEE